jgi:hypothetical protein
MACNCGAGAVCACALRGGTGVVVTGTGTVLDPWVVAAPFDCNSTMDCVGGKAGNGLTYNTGTRVLSAKVGATTGNLLTIGTDQGLYVPPPTAGTGLLYTAGTKTYSTRYSTDAGNTAGAGTDGGIYVPPAGAAGSLAIVANDTADVDFTGNGTTGAPLTAVLKPAAHTITTGNNPDVTLAGDGSAASPLKASHRAVWAHFTQTSGAAIANATGQPLKWATARGYGGPWVPRAAPNDNILDCTIAGVYVFTLNIQVTLASVPPNATAYCQSNFRKNGTFWLTPIQPSGTSQYSTVKCTFIDSFIVGDYVDVDLANWTGVSATPSTSAAAAGLDVARLGG